MTLPGTFPQLARLQFVTDHLLRLVEYDLLSTTRKALHFDTYHRDRTFSVAIACTNEIYAELQEYAPPSISTSWRSIEIDKLVAQRTWVLLMELVPETVAFMEEVWRMGEESEVEEGWRKLAVLTEKWLDALRKDMWRRP